MRKLKKGKEKEEKEREKEKKKGEEEKRGRKVEITPPGYPGYGKRCQRLKGVGYGKKIPKTLAKRWHIMAINSSRVRSQQGS